MKRNTCLTTTLFLLNFAALAQYTGPSSASKTLTVKEVKKDASSLDKNDTQVILTGKIIEQINKDTFWFEDKTGKLQVELEKKHFPTFKFDQNTLVTITGEVDYDLLEEVELEVDSIELAK